MIYTIERTNGNKLGSFYHNEYPFTNSGKLVPQKMMVCNNNNYFTFTNYQQAESEILYYSELIKNDIRFSDDTKNRLLKHLNGFKIEMQ